MDLHWSLVSEMLEIPSVQEDSSVGRELLFSPPIETHFCGTQLIMGPPWGNFGSVVWKLLGAGVSLVQY